MKDRLFIPLIGVLLFSLACNLLSSSTLTQTLETPAQDPESAAVETPEPLITVTASSPIATNSPAVNHQLRPSDSLPKGKLVYDVDSSGTAPEKRAPYGDSYRINRFERPFLKDMTYISDMDIISYSISSDSGWYYVAIDLVGNDPNNKLGIDYGVEIDLDSDGFGDYIIWGHPPFTGQWDTENVQVYADKDHDTGGLSGEQSDAPLSGDGYETLIFNGGSEDPDPDLAWVRMGAGPTADLQFAFKKSLAGSRFMLGALSDAGLRDVTRMDYNDRFTAQQAGSPTRDNQYYPLQSLFAVDNVCREAVGFTLRGNEPQGCPLDKPGPKKPGGTGPAQSCPAPPGCLIWDPVACVCNG